MKKPLLCHWCGKPIELIGTSWADSSSWVHAPDNDGHRMLHCWAVDSGSREMSPDLIGRNTKALPTFDPPVIVDELLTILRSLEDM